MQYELLAQPASTVAKLLLQAGEAFTCEVGAMISMTPGIQVQTSARNKGAAGGGIIKGLKRMFAGENFFLNHFTATTPNQSLIIGPQLAGDIVYHPLRAGSLIVQGSSWLASSTGVEIDATWQGLGKALFSGERMFWVKCSGMGDVFLSSFGAIYEIEVNGDYIVDTGHIVAYEDTLNFKIKKATQGLISSFLSGEGFVCRFEGQGKLYCQSHNPPNFGQLLGPKLRPR